MPVAIALLAWPLIEIALFVTLGGWLGLWLTMAIILGTGIAGVMLLRWRGMQAVGNLRHEIRNMANPVPAVANQALVMLAGVLLILPGFLTDGIALLLLLPPVRALMIAMAARRVVVRRGGGYGGGRAQDDAIEGEFTPLDSDAPPLQGKSRWTQD